MAKLRSNLVKKLENKKRKSIDRLKAAMDFCEAMEVKDDVLKLKDSMRRPILSFRHKKRKINITADSNSDGAKKIIDDIRTLFRDESVILLAKRNISIETFLTEYLSIMWGFLDCSDFATKEKDRAKDPEVVPILSRIAEKLWKTVNDFADSIFLEIYNRLYIYAFAHSSIDSRLYWLKCSTLDDLIGKRKPFEVSICSKQNKEEKITLDGETRRIYPVMWGNKESVISAKLNISLIGQGDKELPVYVQSHVLHRLEERLPQVPLLQYWLYKSIMEPKIAYVDGNYLIEYRANRYKLGYLPISIIDEKVIVRSFLFLTMQGTPEAKLLRQKLNLIRHNIENLKLDDLSQFVTTDIFDDPDLKKVLIECGCEDLSKLRDSVNIDSYEKFAEKMKAAIGKF
ncbi:MAG: hypothetical protein WCO84_08325 [bacterium]